MKVELLTAMVRVEKGRAVSHSAGELVTVPAAEGKRLIARGMARPLFSPRKQKESDG